MNIIERILAPGHRLRPGGNHKKTSVTIHSTGNPGSTAKNERDWLDNPGNGRDAAWHYVAGDGAVIQAIPDREKAWHCGNPEGNAQSLGIEIIETGDRKAVLETAAEFTAGKLMEHGLSRDDIKKHKNWTGKNCPRILIDREFIKDGLDWEWFLQKVGYFMGEGEMENIYNSLDEIPEWYAGAVKKLMDKGYLWGDEKGELGLTETALKVFTINDRAGLYD